MSLVSSERGDGAPAVEGDVEFSRQAVECARIEDVMVPGAGVRTGIDQLDRIDAGGRPISVTSRTLSAPPLGDDAGFEQLLDHRRPFSGMISDLEIGARRDMGIAAGESFGDPSDRGKLPVLEDPVRMRKRHI